MDESGRDRGWTMSFRSRSDPMDGAEARCTFAPHNPPSAPLYSCTLYPVKSTAVTAKYAVTRKRKGSVCQEKTDPLELLLSSRFSHSAVC